MTFKIIERLPAVVALIQCLAGRGSKLTDPSGIQRMAQWARDVNRFFPVGGRASCDGRRNPVGLKFCFPFVSHPVRGPGRGQLMGDGDRLIPIFQQHHPDVHRNHIHSRATAIRRRNGHFHPVTLNGNISDYAQVNDREHGNLRIHHLFQNG